LQHLNKIKVEIGKSNFLILNEITGLGQNPKKSTKNLSLNKEKEIGQRQIPNIKQNLDST